MIYIMNDLDLDITSYDLDDLLNLFKLSYNFDENQLKKSKMIALKTHPDKSGLNIEYFLFFMDAYKALAKVYYFRTKRKDTNFSNKYENEIDDDKYKLLKSLDGKSAKEFNEWFNKMFDKVKINDEEMDFGYEKWYRENEEVKQNKVSLSEFGREFEKRKKECKKIIVHRGVRELKNESGYNLTRDRPVEYSSDIFSKLPFEDLKKRIQKLLYLLHTKILKISQNLIVLINIFNIEINKIHSLYHSNNQNDIYQN